MTSYSRTYIRTNLFLDSVIPVENREFQLAVAEHFVRHYNCIIIAWT